MTVSTATTKTSTRLVSIDVLRGSAVLMVMVHHLPFSLMTVTGGTGDIFPSEAVARYAAFGKYGVHLFLVVSGFSIHMRWARRADRSLTVDWLAFWKRRLRRLYPPYIVMLVAALGGLAGLSVLTGADLSGTPAALFGYESTQQFAIDIVLLLFLLQNLNHASVRVGNSPFWSLALEEQLYVMYIPLLYLRRLRGWPQALVVSGGVSVLWRLFGAVAFDEPPAFWFVVGPAFWLPWALGAFAAEAHHGHTFLPRYTRTWAGVFIFVGLAVYVSVLGWQGADTDGFTWMNDLLVSIGCFNLVAIATTAERDGGFRSKYWQPLAHVGLWSYGLYLVHNPVYVVAKRVALQLGVAPPVVLLVRFAAGMLAGYVFFRVIETPSMRWARRAKVEMRPARSQPQP